MAINVKTIYDTCRNLVKKINEEDKAKGEVNQELLDLLESTFKQILDFERVYLIKAHNRFYGVILMELELEVNFRQRGAVNLNISSIPMSIGVNPMFCSDYSFPEFTFLIIQEIHRMIDLHPMHFKRLNASKDPKIHKNLEDASDASTSSIIQRDVRLEGADNYSGSRMGCKIPKDSLTVSKLNDELGVRSKQDETLKYYFDVINKFRKKDDQPSSSQSQSGCSSSSGSSNSNVASPENNKGEQCHNWYDTDEDEIKDSTISIVRAALNSMSEKEKGNMPSSLVSMINALIAPPQINWKQVLRKMVGSVPVPFRRTRARLNRRQPYRPELTGRLPKRTVNIVVAFDTSGSMSDNDLKYCINEVFNIIKDYEGYKVTIIECDAEIQRVYEAKNMKDVQTKMRGRGGTSFIPVIEFINGSGKFSDNKKYPLAGKYKDAIMVYFTDGWGDYEIPKPKTYRNLWVVLNGEKNLSLKEPYGDVKSLSTDEDFKRFKASQ